MPELRPSRDEEAPKRTYIMKHHFKEHGYTEDCEGCARLSSGLHKTAPHTEECRKRMYEEMGKTEKGKKWMEKAEETINEYVADKVRKDDEKRKEEEQEVTKEKTEATTEDKQKDDDARPILEKDEDSETDGKERVPKRREDDAEGQKRNKKNKTRSQSVEQEPQPKEKRSSSPRREDRKEKVPRFTTARDGWMYEDVSSPGATSSGQGPSIISPSADHAGTRAEKRPQRTN